MKFSAVKNYAIRSDFKFTTFLVCSKVVRPVTDPVAKLLLATQLLAAPNFIVSSLQEIER